MTLAQTVLWPVIYGIAVRFGPWLFPFLSFLLTGVIFTFAAWLNDEFGMGGVEVADIWTGMLVAFGLSVGNTFLAALFSINDEETYDRLVTAPLRRRYRDVPKTTAAGLRLPGDRWALGAGAARRHARGYMPTLKRWIYSGSHKLMQWDPDLSAQTSASQAGILLGSNEGIPAFRWWDKPRQELMVSSKMETAHELEVALSNGDGLLAGGGAGRWNAFSGNAADNIGVFSVFGDASRGLGQHAARVSPLALHAGAHPDALPDGCRSRVVAGVAAAAQERAAAGASRAEVLLRARGHDDRDAGGKPQHPDRRHAARRAGDLQHLLRLRRGGASLRHRPARIR